MSSIIPPTQQGGHLHSLPHDRAGYGSTGYLEGTLIRCDCGAWFECVPCYRSLGPTDEWRQVRWYHRRARRRIEGGAS